jgi:hypothetical protein
MKSRSLSTFVFFDVTYVDGSKRSNRKVLSAVLKGLDGDAAAQPAIEAQDEEIARASGRPRVDIKSVTRSRA